MSQRTRDIVGTSIVFLVLIVGTSIFIYGENFLEHFKAH